MHRSRRLNWTFYKLSGVCQSSAFHIFDFYCKKAESNSTVSTISTSSTTFVFLGRSEKQHGHPASGWQIHFLFSCWNLKNLTEFDKKQDLKVLCQVNAVRTDRKKKIAAPASDWYKIIHFWLLIWNLEMEFNETLTEAIMQCPLPRFFGGR